MRKKNNNNPPDPDSEILLRTFKSAKRPLTMSELRRLVPQAMKPKQRLRLLLKEMLRLGSIVKLKSGRFGLPGAMNLQVGTLWCTRSGNGFVVPDKEGDKDVFVPSRFIKDAMHGDKVVVRVEHTARGAREGKIVKVTERKKKTITGFVKRSRDLFFLVPDDERISSHFIIQTGGKSIDLRENDLAACKITRFPEDGGDPECSVLKVFKGLEDVPSIAQFITYKHNLPLRFKKKAHDDAKQMGLDISPEGRIDLRSTRHVTIDGEFARDFDDAVFIEKTKNGCALYVSIADVSHYVKLRSSLDDEAYARGTSVYFPGSVNPMLPKELSNVICSLNPAEDRLAVTVRLNYDSNGQLLQASFDKSVIRSARRLTYTRVEDALVRQDKDARKELKDVLHELELMGELAAILKEKRERQGNLDFDLPEPEVVLDIEGGIKDILRSERLFSQSVIEEFMIAANEAVARFITERNVPLMYRTHEPPDREKLVGFERLLQTLSIGYKQDTKGRLPLQSILREVQGSDYEFLVNRILLKSMKQARYSAVNKGHFGLALDSYLHFTSPIRRYPDLVCHRILKSVVYGGKPPYDEHELERMALHLSDRERLAMEAERGLEDRIRVLFMKGRIGEVYEGVISHITSYGLFVELFDVFVEGIVLLSSLYDDYYLFQEEKFRLIGRKTKKIFRIGDHVRVRVEMADVERNMLHFALVVI